MKEEEYRELDEAICQLYIIFRAYGARDGVIRLVDFNVSKESHYCILQAAAMAKKINGYPLEIDCNIIDYIMAKIQFNKLVAFKKCKNIDNVMTCDEIVDSVEKEYHSGILTKAYEEYYKK